MKRISAVLLLLFGFTSAASAIVTTGAAEVAAGRAALAAHDLASAQTHFATAASMDDAFSETGAALLGFTRVFALTGQAGTTSLLDGLNVPTSGRDLYKWTAKLPKDGNGNVILPASDATHPAGYNLTTVEAFWLNTLLTQTAAARTALAGVNSPNFLVTLYPWETTGPAAVNIDYGDVLMARASLSAVEFVFHFLSGQNLDANLYAMNQLAQGNLLTLQQVLADNPNLFTLKAAGGSTSERVAAQTAMSQVISLYRQASAIVRARPAGLNRLFMLDPKDVAAEADFRVQLDKLVLSFTEPVATDKGNVAVFTAPLFGPTWVMRDRFPAFNSSTAGFNLESITDPSLGGVAAGLTREAIAGAFDHPELGWTWVSPTPQGNPILRTLDLGGGTLIATGTAGTILRSTNAGSSWTVQRLPSEGSVTGIASGAGKIVVVASNAVYVSGDSGVTWTRAIDNSTSLYAVTFGGNQFVAVGDSGQAAVSSDGTLWTFAPTAASIVLNDVLYTGSVYVGVGYNYSLGKGVIYTSANGSSWTPRLTAASTGYAFNAVAQNTVANAFVAVGAGNRCASASNPTATWTEASVLASAADYFEGVAYRNGVFIAVGYDTSTQAPVLATSSTGGASWTAGSSGATVGLAGVSATAGATYICDWSGAIRISTDSTSTTYSPLLNPTAMVPLGGTVLGSRTIGSSLYLVGSGGAVASFDGTNFTALSSGITDNLWSILQQGGTTFYAVGDSGRLITSTNPAGGFTATTIANASGANLRNISYFPANSSNPGGLFVVTGNNARLLTSTDGSTWTACTTLASPSPTPSDVLYSVAYGVVNGTGTYVAVGGNNGTTTSGVNYVFTSTDGGATWSRRLLGVRNTFRAVVFNQGAFTAAGSGGTIFRSVDGVTWTQSGTGSTYDILSLRVLDGRYYAFQSTNSFTGSFAAQSAVLVSSDGVTWTRVITGSSNNVYSGDLLGGRVYAVGDNSSILRTAPITASSVHTPVLLAPVPTSPVSQGTDHFLAVKPASAEGSQTFAWSKGGTPIPGVTGPVLNLKNVQAADGASYSVTVTNAAGTSSAATFVFPVSTTPAAPIITQQPDSQTVSVGLNAMFSVAAEGTTLLTYQWNKDGSPLSNGGSVSGATTNTLTLTNVQAADAATYTVVVSGTGTPATSNGAVLTVDSNPAYTFSTLAGLAFNSGTSDSLSGPGSLARFSSPNGVAVDASGNIYVADTNNGAIRKVTPAGVVSTIIPVPSGIGSPVGIVLVGSTLYFTTTGQVVRSVGTDGSGSTVLVGAVGSSGSTDAPVGPVAGSGGTNSPARFNNPKGITADASGNLYVADTNNNKIRKVVIATGVVSTFAGSGSAGSTNGTGAAASFNGPRGIAIDPAGLNLFVADTNNNTIRKIVISSGVVTTFAGQPGFFGTFDGSGSPAGSGPFATFAAPVGIAVDSAGYVYVADNSGQKLRKIAPDGSFVRTIGGQPFWQGNSDGVGSDARFNMPSGIALDSAANLYIADTNSHTIRKGVPSASILAPAIGILPRSQAVTIGGNVTFGVTATGVGTLSYQWRKNGVNIGGATGTSLTLTSLQAGDAGNYTVAVTSSAGGSAVSAIAALTVAPGPEITGQPTGRAVRVGANVSFSVVASGASTYQWLKNLVPIGGATSATLSFTNVQAADAGSYVVVVSNSSGSVASRVAVLTVNAVSDGTVVAWGYNSYGETSVPDGLNGVTAIAAGFLHTVALKSDGTVVAWGQNFYGQTTVPTDLSGVTAIAAGYYHSVALKSNGTVVGWGTAFSSPPAGLSGVTAIAAGNGFTVALKSDGTVVAWGNNGNGQTSVPIGLSGVTAIAAGYFHTVALKSDGTVVAWGAGTTNTGSDPNYGQSIIPAGLSGVTAIAAGYFHSVALKSDGTVVAWGNSEFGATAVPFGLSGVTAIAAGWGHTVALKGDRTVVAWGRNSDLSNSISGQVWVPAGLSGVTAIAAGGFHTVALVMPPNITAPPAGQSASAGANVSFSVGASGASTYQWLKNGVPIDGETAAALSLTNVQAAAGAVYTIVVSNAGGTAVASATLAVGSDFFAGRTVISSPGGTTLASNVGATKESGEPSHAGNVGGASVWWTWTAPNTGVVTVDTIGSSFDTLLAVYTGSALGSLTPVASDDNSGSYGTSKVTFNVIAGTVYQIAVDGFGGVSGNIVLNLNYAYAFITFAGSGAFGHADGTGTSAQFSQPAGVALDGAGNLYVADVGDFTIRKITPAGVVTTLAGLSGSFAHTDGTGSGASFAQPVGVAVDSGGNVFVVELGNGTPGALRKVTPAGVVTTLATGFNQPFGVAVDGAGNVYVTDSNNSTIKKVTSAGVVTTVAGQSGVFGDTDGPVSVATLGGPVSLAIDAAGNIFVATGSQTIRKITPAGIVSTFAGSAASFGAADGAGSAARFDGPYGLAFDSAGNLYVAERGVGSVAGHTIRRISPAGVVTTLAGQPLSPGSVDGVGSVARFNQPIGIAVDAAGNIFVGDLANHTIRKGSFAFAPQIQTQPPANQTVALGGTATFTVGATSGLPFTYQWQKGGVNVSGAVNVTLTLNNLQGTDSGNYTVVVSNIAGSVTSSTATLTVNVPPAPTVSAVSPTSGTSGTIVTLTGTGFTGATAVKFNGLAAAFTIVSTTSITATVPLGVTSGAVTVVGPGGASPATATYTVVVTPVSQTLYVATGQGSNAQLFIVDPATAAATLVGNITMSGIALNVTGLAFNPLTGVLYGVTGGESGPARKLVTINPANGLATLVGTLNVDGVTTGSSDISFDANEKLYTWRTQGGPLGMINLSTAAITAVGSGLNGGGGNGLAFTPDGTLYLAGPPTGNLSTVNTVTGTLATVAGLTGAPEVFGTINAMASDSAGLLYAVSNASPSTLVTINPATGVITTVGTLSFSNADAIAFSITASTPPPTITLQPVAAVTANGGSVTFSVAASGSPAPTYRWQFNNVNIPGATSPTLTLNNVGTANVGTYRVIVTNVNGNVPSDPVTLAINERSLLNLLSRVTVPALGSVGSSFTIEGGAKNILIRGVGPSLTGVTGVLADPRLTLLNGTLAPIATNDDWGTPQAVTGGPAPASASAISAAIASVAASPGFTIGSKDAALLVSLAPGTYTAVLDGVGGAGGIALLEIVDADTGAWPRLAMLAMRGPVTGDNHLIVGFNLTGTGARKYLIRVLGESLGANYNYNNGVLIDPIITLYQGTSEIASDDDSGPDSVVDAAAAAAGAQPRINFYSEGSYTFDSTLFLDLDPGSYTADIRPFSPPAESGDALFEIFAADDLHPATIAPAITYLSPNQQALSGGDAALGVVTVSKPAATFQWRRYVNGVPNPISGATASVLRLTGLQLSDSGSSYDVVISNGTTAITSPQRTVTVLPYFHSADTNQDHQISLIELTRVIQLYNYANGAVRTGEYHTQADTEDGFAPGPGAITTYHSADSNRDGRIDAPELSRVIELYNFVNGTVRTGEYHAAGGTEDGFAPGPGQVFSEGV